MNIVVDGLLASYQRLGSGKTVILLHGWGDSSQTFAGLQKELAAHYDTISFDLPGFGNSEPPKETWGLDNYARFIAHALDKLGIGSVYAVIGHSNGGAIAIRGLGQWEFKSDRLVLLASAGIRSEYKGRKHALRIAAKAAKALTLPLPGRAKKRLKRQAYKTIGSDLFVAEHLQETFKKVVTDDVLMDAQKLALPTLIIYGGVDTATPPRYAEKFHQAISGSVLEMLPKAGHFLLQEQPEEVTGLIEEFLDA